MLTQKELDYLNGLITDHIECNYEKDQNIFRSIERKLSEIK